jgi:hypothetical protein
VQKFILAVGGISDMLTWEARRTMDQYTKDAIDAVSKIAGVLGFFVAIFVAFITFKKNRDERRTSAEKDRQQRERQLTDARDQAEKYQEQKRLQIAQMELNRKIDGGRFYLELRRLFGDYTDAHVKLRGGGWRVPKPLTIGHKSKLIWVCLSSAAPCLKMNL